ncbi:hypothetical protein Ae168Ps1_0577c [Pseudonocardia sp. Ae168_Ps1]|uniref:hypothetical protein n=1 Tax=unclassified Pseudonocardia TaxID=2619320 RepID=UPI00094AF895|nr:MULTISPECIES: hypothetical protein [unclassified Pseudonocardia]OLL72202.1 hypothetical protein Ae150APs1_0580c [Pseudonocardia sp. Ae150A_Ps1]OLL78171.1 hypothetical protein Ae168Ps1_0577c [Pseudonocardia sp. Ae168_Ps1]OLL87707.1 hypothetical protein Ae263Ps1_4762 [Pseudonocardia sp. Ae263_Ps1]OLL92266.1 hypothetical protein Ae356Ps1_2163c [Pseudonocardia sp. Ae356_Ps1]
MARALLVTGTPSEGPGHVEDERAAELAVAFAALAGREIGGAEARAAVAHARGLGPAEANAIWARHRRAPRTVALRDYLAMTLRFVEQDPAQR